MDKCNNCGAPMRAGYYSPPEEDESKVVKQLRELVEAQEQLLICYRLGTQRGAGTAVDKIRKLKDKLGIA